MMLQAACNIIISGMKLHSENLFHKSKTFPGNKKSFTSKSPEPVRKRKMVNNVSSVNSEKSLRNKSEALVVTPAGFKPTTS